MTPSFAYIRVSGKGQVEGDGFRRQEETIGTFAAASGYEIRHVYREEGVSGTAGEEERPAFQEMLTDILKNGVRTVIVEGLDRLAREYRIQETLLIYLASKGVEVLVARTGENVTEAIEADPMRKALVQIQGIFSELEKNLLVKKLRVARERLRVEKGKCEGRKSYAEAAPGTLMEIRRLRRKRKGVPPMTYREIADSLNSRGVRTMDGKEFTKEGVMMILRRARG